MTAYRDAFGLFCDSSGDRVSTAASLLREAKATVLVEDWVALRPIDSDALTVEVIDRTETSDDAARYERLIVQAKGLLADSLFACLVDGMRLDWLVVQDYGTGTIQVWPPISKT